MKVLVAMTVLLAVIHLNEGCSGISTNNRNRVEPTTPTKVDKPTTSPKVEEPATAANVKPTLLSRGRCKRDFSGFCLTSTRCSERRGDAVGKCKRNGQVCCVLPVRQLVKTEAMKVEITTAPPEAIPTEPAIENTTAPSEVTPTEPITENTTAPSEVIPTEKTSPPEVKPTVNLETPSSLQATRPTSLFGFRSKTFGLQTIQNTETCTGDVNGQCRLECKSNEYLRGRFDCQGKENCCVPR